MTTAPLPPPLTSSSALLAQVSSSATALTAGSLAGIAWNVFGVVQFWGSLRSTTESLMQMGMTPEQAHVMASYPDWMHVAFALGVFGGLAGSVLLFLRRSFARPVLLVSLVGYLALYVGDVTAGVFAALGASQVAILSTVVAIAAALFFWSRSLERHGALR